MIRLALNPECPVYLAWWDSGGCAMWYELVESAWVTEVAVPAGRAHTWLERARQIPGWQCPNPPVLAVQDAEEDDPWHSLPVAWWAPPEHRQ